MDKLTTIAWPVEQVAEAIQAIATRRGWISLTGSDSNPGHAPSDDARLGESLEVIARSMGVDADPVEVTYPGIDAFVGGAAPALLHLSSTSSQPGSRFVAIVKCSKRKVAVLAPDHSIHHISTRVLSAALGRELETPVEADVDQLLARAGVPHRRQARARVAILREQLSQTRIRAGWILRLPASASLWKQICDAGLRRSLFAPVALFLAQYLCTVLAWGLLGRRAFDGHFDYGWLIAWALLLLTAVPLQLVGTWAQGRFSIGAAGLLKRKLLDGAMRLQPEEIRHKGAGQLLGEIIESSNVESLALNGGFVAIAAVVELIVAAIVLALCGSGITLVVLLAGWVGVTCMLCRMYFRRSRDWTTARLAMTNDLVERMAGHRTRLAQETRERWHEGEDHVMEGYLDRSKAMDRAAVLQSLSARGWIVVGLLGLAPTFILASSSAGALAIAIGGMLLAFRGLQKLTSSWSSLTSAAIAWRQVAHLISASARAEDVGNIFHQPGFGSNLESDAQPFVSRRSSSRLSSPVLPVLMDAHDLSFRYRETGDPVISESHLQIREGDRLLLEGGSGSGKSTFAAMLAGLRKPSTGLLLLTGLDRQTLGAREWRRRVAAAPQFHENHVLTGTFAFNLLMGREWPPSEMDLQEAETVCNELGLGELLERMPAGLQQMVGETGWQLSHGERSRLFLARALLQRAKMVILDESFGALDPANLERALRCTLDRARTLLVIAHP